MNMNNYKQYISAEILMGPNSARVLAELLQRHPLHLTAQDKALDLGCGKGLTSLVLARETSARICAADLWITAEENAQRFHIWGIDEQVTPVHADAAALPFDEKMFSALVSVDAYHYFGTPAGFFAEKMLPFLKDGAEVLIGIPGVKDEFAGRCDELLSDWLGDEAYMFRSPAEWQEIIGTHERIAAVETWEMGCFDLAWDEWFATGHEYALGDLRHFDTLIKPYTCFVGIHIRLKP